MVTAGLIKSFQMPAGQAKTVNTPGYRRILRSQDLKVFEEIANRGAKVILSILVIGLLND